MAAGAQTFDRVEPFTVTVPAGTTQAAPLETSLAFLPGEVVAVDLRIPPGHNGRTGIALAQAHQPVFPERAGAFVTDSDVHLQWAMADTLDTGDWQAFTFNLSSAPHQFFIRFYVVEIAKRDRDTPVVMLPLVL